MGNKIIKIDNSYKSIIEKAIKTIDSIEGKEYDLANAIEKAFNQSLELAVIQEDDVKKQYWIGAAAAYANTLNCIVEHFKLDGYVCLVDRD
jgi:hypothetical protein